MRVVLRVLIVLTLPMVLTMGVVRLVTLPWYPAWEYRRPGFPEDPLGMDLTERLNLARVSINYLNLPRGFVSLDALHFEDGTPAYNTRELSHMVDVKLVYNRLTGVATLALVIAILSGWLIVRNWGVVQLWGALSDGGLFTLVLLIGLGIWMLVGFEAFFTAFHGVFFEGDTWLFEYSDTLIRLFPIRFWADAGMIVAGAVSILALIFALSGRVLQRRIGQPDVS